MKREYHKWFSPSLGRDMELLVFGHSGVPALVFPTSQGRFYEFEDRGMVNAVAGELEHGHLQLFCVDSIDSESWYNRAVPPRWRIARHMQYEQYLMHEPASAAIMPSTLPSAIPISSAACSPWAEPLTLQTSSPATTTTTVTSAFPRTISRTSVTIGISIATGTTPTCLRPASTTSAGTTTNAWRRSFATKEFLVASMSGAATQVTTGHGGSACCKPIYSQ